MARKAGAFKENVAGLVRAPTSTPTSITTHLGLDLAREGEDVLGLAVRDLVDAEPLVGRAEEAGEVALEVLDRVDLGGKGVVDVNDNDLPVGLALVEEGHDAEDLDLLDLAGVADSLTDLADVKRVVVTVGTGLGVLVVGVLPGLGEGTVVPDVAVVGEAVADVAELALLGVLTRQLCVCGAQEAESTYPGGWG